MKSLLFFITCSFLMGMTCKKELLPTEKEVQYNMSAVSGPTTAQAGRVVSFTVSYPFSNGCQKIQRFTQGRKDNIITVKAFGIIDTTAICTQNAGTATILYQFSSASPATIELRFTNQDGSFISHTITFN